MSVQKHIRKVIRREDGDIIENLQSALESFQELMGQLKK
jgi:hypothetical protein